MPRKPNPKRKRYRTPKKPSPAPKGEEHNKALAIMFPNRGRPPLYKTPEELQSKITEYFHNCPDKRYVVTQNGAVEVPTVTITGLALYLGFCDRHSLYDMEAKEGFSHTIKKARTFIEKDYEMCLRQTGCSGAIFALKNFGWKDEVINTAPPVNAPANIHFHFSKDQLKAMSEQELTDILLGRSNKKAIDVKGEVKR